MSEMLGMDKELNVMQDEEREAAASFEDAAKKRRPFLYWTVNGVDHKLKLTSAMITKLEEKYGANVLAVIVSADVMPPLSTMLTIAQCAMAQWEHGTTIERVQKIYDAYVDEGGNQTDFLNKIIMPTLMASGFFSQEQEEAVAGRT